jgi:superfamily II DNA or RNA helicase
LEYQVDAIKRWIKILNEHNWVIVADVVWLGKSVIWSSLLWNIWQKAIIIAPPHLVDQWNDYKKRFWNKCWNF